MNIQSLSVCVPGGCPNKCKFCVSKMHDNKYPDLLDENYYTYRKRLEFSRDNGCNTLIFTGTGEPLYNTDYIYNVLTMNDTIHSPFKWIEIQTSGVCKLDFTEELLKLKRLGLTTVSLSLSSIWSDDENADYNGMKKPLYIKKTCDIIKNNGLNLRLSLNMTDVYSGASIIQIFDKLMYLGADQVTFRELYTDDTNDNSRENTWIKDHSISKASMDDINWYVVNNGVKLEKLPFGATRYAVDGISTVIDSDCMSTEIKDDVVKYLVLRPNCKLYTRWDNEGSLLF